MARRGAVTVRRSLPPADDRGQAGRSARRRRGRRDLGAWDPARRDHDALRTLAAQNAIRGADLVPIRWGRMSASPWTYYRGAAAVMAADLAGAPHSGLLVQLCGDAHVLNYGLWATPERVLAFDLRDFDETLPGPFEWDVQRFAASLVVLAREYGVTDTTAAEAVGSATAAYRTRMRAYADLPRLEVWYDRIEAADLINELVPEEQQDRAAAWLSRRARRRTSAGAARKLIRRVDGRRQIEPDPPFRVRLDHDGLALVDEVFAGYRSSLPNERRYLLDRFAFADAARQVVGVGSVGMRVFLALLEGPAGEPLFLQFKQAGPAVYEEHLWPSDYPNHGQRVVVGKRFIQSATDIFVGWTSVNGLDFYVRQFRDMKVVPDGETVAPRLADFAVQCAKVLAKAHARTGDPMAIASYIGKGDAFADGITRFALAYADQNERDHAQLGAAVRDGSVLSARGW